MITWLIWTSPSSVPRKAVKFNHSLTHSLTHSLLVWSASLIAVADYIPAFSFFDTAVHISCHMVCTNSVCLMLCLWPFVYKYIHDICFMFRYSVRDKGRSVGPRLETIGQDQQLFTHFLTNQCLNFSTTNNFISLVLNTVLVCLLFSFV